MKFQYLLTLLSLFLGAAQLKAAPNDKKCSTKFWSMGKQGAKKKKIEQRQLNLGKYSLIWCNQEKKYVREVDYYKLIRVEEAGPKIKIWLNQTDAKRKPTKPIVLIPASERDKTSFITALSGKIIENLREYNCSRANPFTLKKRGASGNPGANNVRSFHLGSFSLYWCHDGLARGYIPYSYISQISNSEKQITIKVYTEHRGRGKEKPFVLQTTDKLQLIRFIAALKNKQYSSSTGKAIHLLLKGERATGDNNMRLEKITKMPKTTTQQKLHRSKEKAKIIGKGLAELDKQGVVGKELDQRYWKEALSREHFFGLSTSKVSYLATEESRRPFKLTFHQRGENAFLQRGGKVFNTQDHSTAFSGRGSAIFVIAPNKVAYAGSHMVGRFHHSSFLAGSAVLSAGEIRTNSQGEIIWFSNKSGHYKPDLPQVLNALRFFQSKGVDLRKVTFMDMMTGIETNAATKLQQHQ